MNQTWIYKIKPNCKITKKQLVAWTSSKALQTMIESPNFQLQIWSLWKNKFSMVNGVLFWCLFRENEPNIYTWGLTVTDNFVFHIRWVGCKELFCLLNSVESCLVPAGILVDDIRLLKQSFISLKFYFVKSICNMVVQALDTEASSWMTEHV